MNTNYFNKDPNADLDYANDWAAPSPQGPWLVEGDSIATSTWTVPPGLTSHDPSMTATTTTIWLAGGTDGVTYPVVNHITTSQGRVFDQTLYVTIRDN